MAGTGRCIRHSDSTAQDNFIRSVRGGAVCDLRGVTVSRDLLDALIAAFSQSSNGKTCHGLLAERANFLDSVDLSACRFVGDTVLDRAIFHGDVSFEDAVFEGTVKGNNASFVQRVTFSSARFSASARFGGTHFGSGSFDNARFDELAWFDSVTWRGSASFRKVWFEGVAWFGASSFFSKMSFSESQFADHATFDRCTFHDAASFVHTTFSGRAGFVDAMFAGQTSFDHITCKREVRFNRTEIHSGADFNNAQFLAPAWWERVTVERELRFEQARFADQVNFAGATVEAGLWLTGAQFGVATTVGPLDAGSALILDEATFQESVRLGARAQRVTLVDCRFMGGGELRFPGAEVVCDRATFAAATTLVGTGTGGVGASRTRLLSMRHVDVSHTSLVDVDLSACLFDGAHHIDGMRIEGMDTFATSPKLGPWRLGRLELQFWHRRTVRQCLAEEHAWRSQHASRWEHWYPPETRPPSWVAEHTGHPVAAVPPHRIASTYRALRKAREDARNQPGAADFYYGEMEMRRYSKATPTAERLLLHLYWLASGYGLRASRALLLLAALLVAHGFLFTLFGFAGTVTGAPDYGSWHGHLYALDMLLFSPDSDVRLTAVGQLLKITLRISGPILLGLGVLAIRGRIRR